MFTPLIAELTLTDWLQAAAVALGTIALAVLIRRFTKRRIRRKNRHAELIDFGGRILIAILLPLGAFYTLLILDIEIIPALGAVGVGALFIAVGLQPILVNLVGSFILQTRRPFRRGDQIKSHEFEGTVIDITTTSTEILSYSGESIHIPNGAVLGNPLVNWTHEPVRRSTMPITVPYGCDLRKVLATLGRAARGALDDEKLPPAEALAIGFGNHGIELAIYYWHYSDNLEYRVARNNVATAVDDALREIGVAIPYPQLVVHPDDTNETGN